MLLRGGRIATLDPRRVEAAELRIEGELIVERGAGLPPRAGEEVVELGGSLLLPGLVNAHTHLYSTLARGMPAPAPPPRGFLEILERVWWRLDRALDMETVELSALAGAIEAARSGTTLLVDHHSSPSCIRGSLQAVQRAVERVGLRSVLCYETTDRNGTQGRDQGLQENQEFLAQAQTALTRGMPGAHAAFTLGEDSLARLASLARESGRGVHLHVAEDALDVRECCERHGADPLARLRRHGLLAAGAVFAHAVHLEPEEVEEVQQAGVVIAHCPRSNQNNGVGRAPTAAFRTAALGTDGIDQDLLAELRAAFLGMRADGRSDAAEAALRLLAGGHRLGAALFGAPLGRLEPGAPADLLVLDYAPPTPLHASNLAGHLLFGLDRSHVVSLLVAGRFVLRDRRITALDAEQALGRARAAAARLWARL
jgi:putative selenium metabolism protein SsnA